MSDDFFRNRLDEMIDLKHPLAVLAARLPWDKMKAAIEPNFAYTPRPVKVGYEEQDLLGEVCQISGGEVSQAGRPLRTLRLMMALSLLKNSFDLSDEEFGGPLRRERLPPTLCRLRLL